MDNDSEVAAESSIIEAKYKNILESIGDHVSLIDRDFNIVWANRVAKDRYGDNIIGKKCYNIYHGLEQPCEPSPCITMKTLKDGKVHNHETTTLDRHGRKIYLNCSANVAVYDEKNNPIIAVEVSSDITAQKIAEEERDRVIKELKEAIENIKVLTGLLPICARCKNIRDDKGYWHNVEEYFKAHSDTKFSHSICPECRKELYGDIKKK